MTRDLDVLATDLTETYEDRFRNAGLELSVSAGRAGVLSTGRRRIERLGILLTVDGDGFHDHAHFHVAERASPFPWRRTTSLKATREVASRTLDRWLMQADSR